MKHHQIFDLTFGLVEVITLLVLNVQTGVMSCPKSGAFDWNYDNDVALDEWLR